MVCLGNICINTLHKEDNDDDDEDDDYDNNNNKEDVTILNLKSIQLQVESSHRVFLNKLFDKKFLVSAD